MSHRKPVNPIGECFDSVGHQVVYWLDRGQKEFKICHGIGIATMRGQEGNFIKHAWLERDGKALDTTWGVRQDAHLYRKNLTLQYVIEYTPDEFIANWAKTDYPGPWDEKIKAVKGKRG